MMSSPFLGDGAVVRSASSCSAADHHHHHEDSSSSSVHFNTTVEVLEYSDHCAYGSADPQLSRSEDLKQNGNLFVRRISPPPRADEEESSSGDEEEQETDMPDIFSPNISSSKMQAISFMNSNCFVSPPSSFCSPPASATQPASSSALSTSHDDGRSEADVQRGCPGMDEEREEDSTEERKKDKRTEEEEEHKLQLAQYSLLKIESSNSFATPSCPPTAAKREADANIRNSNNKDNTPTSIAGISNSTKSSVVVVSSNSLPSASSSAPRKKTMVPCPPSNPSREHALSPSSARGVGGQKLSSRSRDDDDVDEGEDSSLNTANGDGAGGLLRLFTVSATTTPEEGCDNIPTVSVMPQPGAATAAMNKSSSPKMVSLSAHSCPLGEHVVYSASATSLEAHGITTKRDLLRKHNHQHHHHHHPSTITIEGDHPAATTATSSDDDVTPAKKKGTTTTSPAPTDKHDSNDSQQQQQQQHSSFSSSSCRETQDSNERSTTSTSASSSPTSSAIGSPNTFVSIEVPELISKALFLFDVESSKSRGKEQMSAEQELVKRALCKKRRSDNAEDDSFATRDDDHDDHDEEEESPWTTPECPLGIPYEEGGNPSS